MSDFQAVKDRIDFRQYVGRYYKINGQKKILCLFHADKSPSMHIYADSYYCFQCGAAGDIFDFAMKQHRWDKQEALIELAREAGVTLTPLNDDQKAQQDKRERMYSLLDDAAQCFEYALSINTKPMNYLVEKRGLSLDTITHCRLGYAPEIKFFILPALIGKGYKQEEIIEAGFAKRDGQGIYERFHNRIMIPIRDHKGRVVGFSGRAMTADQTPKYLYNTNFEKTSVVHRMPQNDARRGVGAFSTLVVVEGSLDPISAANRGVYNVVSQLGTSLSDAQLSILCRDGVTRLVFCLDNDKAGTDALKRLVDKHLHTAADMGVDLYAMTAPHGKDPDDTFREHPDLWAAAVDAARPVVDVLIERAACSVDASTGDKTRMINSLLPLLKGENGLVTHDNLSKLSRATGYPVERLDQWTTAQLTVLPQTKPAAPAPLAVNIPETELKVLHGILINDDQRWLDRANVNLSRVGDFPKALQPLSQNDFLVKPTRDLMACITQGAKGERPFDDYVRANAETGPLSEIYYRAFYRPVVQSILNVNAALALDVMEWRDFLAAVFRLRINRLTHDLLTPTGVDVIEWIHARKALQDNL